MVTKTASTALLHAGEHLFKVAGPSLVKGSNTCLTSGTFRVGGHDWAILYYPNGTSRVVDDQFTSIFLKLINTLDAAEVTASYSFCPQDHTPSATCREKHKFSSYTTAKFAPGKHDNHGTQKFMSKADDLVESTYLKDDSLVIKCTVTVIASKLVDDHEDMIILPPSVLSKDLGNLLENGVIKADLTVQIGWFKSFKVHGCILAARSPVFRALLCGSMMESKQTSIRVNNLDAKVFEVLLYYMYNDRLPEFMEETTTEDAVNMTRNLLVAADQYAMERLKLICEAKLSEAVGANTIGSTLNLAELFNCQQLKNYCLKYIARDTERIRSIIKSNSFKGTHQGVADGILDKVNGKL